MSEKRFTFRPTQIETFHLFEILDNGERLCIVRDIDVEKVVDLLNEQQATITNLEEYCGDLEADVKRLMKENEQLRTQLLICQQSNDDGRFKVWEVPPIPKGTRITFSTTERSGKNE